MRAFIRGCVTQRVQRSGQVISPALDVEPSGVGVRGRERARGLRGTHRIVESRAFRTRIDDAGLPPGRSG
jgi:hypothetical protein